jgi:hypothetical protein
MSQRGDLEAMSIKARQRSDQVPSNCRAGTTRVAQKDNDVTWTDRGNRVATLTIWSRNTGVVSIGSNVRPGRAAATPDGRFVMYERDITATTANVALGPIPGMQAVVAGANSADSTCWQTTDLVSVGGRLLVRFCPGTSTTFTLRSYTGERIGQCGSVRVGRVSLVRNGPGRISGRRGDGRLGTRRRYG